MATANQVLSSTNENENYQRLSRLIIRAGTELLRTLFNSIYPAKSLANKLSDSTTRKELRDILLKPQRDLVYPAPGLFGESRDFDISLLSQLLKTLCPTQLPPLRSGWNRLPSTGDFSLTADIVRIKFYRNDIIHKFHSGELSDAEFCSLWDEIKIVLLRIASHISAETKLEWEEEINRLRRDPLTPEAARNAEELQEMYQRDMIAKECLASGFARVEGQIQDLRNQIVQLRRLVTNLARSSSAEGGAPLRIIIDVESMTSRISREEAPTTTISLHAQPNASADEPPATFTIRVDQSIRRIVVELCRHYDPSTAEENGFVQHLEDVNQVLTVDVNLGSLVLTVICSSLEILERFWQDYSSGHLGKIAQEFLVTERVLEDLGLVELKLKITISEEDYREGRRQFAKCAGSDYSEETEGGQNGDGKEEEYIPSQHFTGIHRKLSLLPQAVPHFVNRETECEKIREYLSPLHDCRCVHIHGATGMGKTTVATKVANDILNSDGRTVVIYVNCRNIKLSHDFAEKALQQVYHVPVENPIPELKNRLKSQDFFTILLLDNFEFILNLDDRMQLPESELLLQQKNPTEEGSKIKNLINEILMVADKVKLLVTSSEKVSFPESGQEMVHLSPFKPEESVELLRRVWKDRQVDTTQAHDLSEICSGIPLVLYTLASSHNNLLSLLKEMTCSSPQEKFEFLTKIQTERENMKINVCIDYCFERLDWKEKCALIRFALLRRRFSLCEAEKIFQSTEMSAFQLRRCGLELSQRSLLEEHIIGDECSYTLLRVIRDYCETKAMEPEFCEVILDARRAFILHFLTFLEDIFKMFLSQNVSEAIAAFQKDEANVMQLVEWCRNGQMDEEQTGRCIDVFNSVAELLAKMMAKAKFKFSFESLQTRCEQMEDQTRLSDCLTSLGLKEVFSCSCPPIGLCASTAERAKEYFTRADQIQDNLGVRTGNSRAQCLAKLGRCLAKEGSFEEAKEKVRQAIKIRSEREDDNVMLGATYNDQGVILSLEGNHEQAIKVREDQTLPIYKKTIGHHPFTATILNSLSNNYYALGEYNTAERYSKEALEIQLELLKNHRDTAKSFFDLAMVHKMKKEFKPAEEYLERCEAMQKKILDEGNDALKRTRNELEEVKRHLLGAMQGNS